MDDPRQSREEISERSVEIPSGGALLRGDLAVCAGADGIVLFAHGSGSGRKSPRNRHVAGVLQRADLATLLADLLTEDEERVDLETRHLRFDIPLLADRLIDVIDWIERQPDLRPLPVGLFGASTGAAAAILATVARPQRVRAIVSRGGRPDLADEALTRVAVPTLLIVGGNDEVVLGLNQWAFGLLPVEKDLIVVPGATHLFEEAGTLDAVASAARDWFRRHLGNKIAAENVSKL